MSEKITLESQAPRLRIASPWWCAVFFLLSKQCVVPVFLALKGRMFRLARTEPSSGGTPCLVGGCRTEFDSHGKRISGLAPKKNPPCCARDLLSCVNPFDVLVQVIWPFGACGKVHSFLGRGNTFFFNVQTCNGALYIDLQRGFHRERYS